MRPVLIQNAASDPRHRDHPAVRLGFTRYLGVPILRSDMQVVGTLCFLDDRSDALLQERDVEFLSILATRVAAELERERLIEERLERERAAAAQMAELNRQLARALDEQRHFVAMVIHDLAQPLAAMRTTLHVLRTETDPRDRAESAGMLESSLGGLADLVRELTDYQEIQGGKVLLRLEPVNLEECLTGCAEEFLPEARRRGISLSLDIPPELGTARTDRTKLCRIVRNLISNALRHGATGLPDGQGRIHIRASPRDSRSWELQIADNGNGMPSDPVACLAGEPRSTARSSTAKGRTSGLGLIIVRQFCAAMGAGISVETEPGQGTCVTLSFPREHAAMASA